MKFLNWLERKFTAGVSLQEPIEIRRAILREIVDQVQSKGGGEAFFPYSEVAIELLARDPAEQQLFEASFDQAEIQTEVRSQIAERGCQDVGVAVHIAVKEEAVVAGAVPYRLKFHTKPQVAPVMAPRPPARLIVMKGTADAAELPVVRDLVYIGRLKEVLSKAGNVERRNELAFDASEKTVHRKHAWIRYDGADGVFRAFNDSSASRGTRVLRDGRSLECDPYKGVQLRSGDELLLGDARVRFEIDR